eukprot:14577470-Alexandrium_andersonii.AAC.1
MVAAPRARDQVARQPDQRRPVRGGGVWHSPAQLLRREPQVRAIQAEHPREARLPPRSRRRADSPGRRSRE